MIKASSLVYAIFICLLVSLMTGGLIHWSSTSNSLSAKHKIKQELIDYCNSCFNYALTTPQATNNTITDLFNDGFKCIINKNQWGLLTILKTKAFFYKDSINTIYFIGNKKTKNRTALYLSDLSENLKLSGTTKIHGDLKLPKKGYEITNILGNQQINNPKINGKINSSNESLPQININASFPSETILTTLDELNKQQITFNSFNNKTIRVQLGSYETLSNVTLKGNFILNSSGYINIDNNSTIEDVIINAKSVSINSSFNGSLQIFASEEVIIKSDVILNYPSSVVVSNSFKNEKKITIDRNSKILGGILINTEGVIDIKNNNLFIAKESLIIGDVYCNGIMELKGEVIGSVYTNKFVYNTEYSNYSNLLLNTTIDNSSLPENFIYLPYFKESTEIAFGTIKKIQ